MWQNNWWFKHEMIISENKCLSNEVVVLKS